MELDDWDFSTEELDSLERDAFKQIAERKSSSLTTTSSSASIPTGPYRQQQDYPSSNLHTQQSPAKARHSKVDASPSASRLLPASVESIAYQDNDLKEQRKVYVKLFVHSTGGLAAKFQYDEVLVRAFRQISKASWNGKEKSLSLSHGNSNPLLI